VYKKIHEHLIHLHLLYCIKRNSPRGKAVSSNGKFATINGLKLYYEELGELLTTKNICNSRGDKPQHQQP